MREAKYRVWDNKDCRMIIDEQIMIPLIITNKGILRLSPYYKDDLWKIIDFDTRFELMQYVGFKDTNGKEIYEGDIVKGYWWEKGEQHRHIGRVAYVMNKFVARGVKQYFGFDDNDLNPTYEVIGNIYENVEMTGREE